MYLIFSFWTSLIHQKMSSHTGRPSSSSSNTLQPLTLMEHLNFSNSAVAWACVPPQWRLTRLLENLLRLSVGQACYALFLFTHFSISFFITPIFVCFHWFNLFLFVPRSLFVPFSFLPFSISTHLLFVPHFSITNNILHRCFGSRKDCQAGQP